jgi:hypothetical protein
MLLQLNPGLNCSSLRLGQAVCVSRSLRAQSAKADTAAAASATDVRIGSTTSSQKSMNPANDASAVPSEKAAAAGQDVSTPAEPVAIDAAAAAAAPTGDAAAFSASAP